MTAKHAHNWQSKNLLKYQGSIRALGFRILSTFILILGCTFLSSTEKHAEAAEVSSMHVRVGEVFEVGIEKGSAESKFNWILQKDGVFQGAQRHRFYQGRLSQPGRYTLDVSIQDSVNGSVGEYRSIGIIAEESQGRADDLEGSQSPLSIDIKPMGGITLKEILQNGGILRIEPQPKQGFSLYAIDTNTRYDSNTDGDPRNDHDTQDSLSERTGSPLYLWIEPSPMEREISLKGTEATSNKVSEFKARILDSSQETSSKSEKIESYGSIQVQKKGTSVSFSLSKGLDYQSYSTLYLWDFGDGSRSMLNSPTHNYKGQGVFEVRLDVIDISTGNQVHQERISLDIVESQKQTSSVSSSVESAVSSSPNPDVHEDTPKESSGGFLARIIERATSLSKVALIVLLLFALAMGMYSALMWIKKMTAGKLQSALEKMEEGIVKNEPPTTKKQETEPMQIKVAPKPERKQDDVLDRETAKKEFAKNEQPIPKNQGPVPPWLSNTTTPTEKKMSPASPPTPTKPVPSAPTAPPAAKAPVVTPASEAKEKPKIQPPWLSSNPVKLTTETQTKTVATPSPINPLSDKKSEAAQEHAKVAQGNVASSPPSWLQPQTKKDSIPEVKPTIQAPKEVVPASETLTTKVNEGAKEGIIESGSAKSQKKEEKVQTIPSPFSSQIQNISPPASQEAMLPTASKSETSAPAPSTTPNGEDNPIDDKRTQVQATHELYSPEKAKSEAVEKNTESTVRTPNIPDVPQNISSLPSPEERGKVEESASLATPKISKSPTPLAPAKVDKLPEIPAKTTINSQENTQALSQMPSTLTEPIVQNDDRDEPIAFLRADSISPDDSFTGQVVGQTKTPV